MAQPTTATTLTSRACGCALWVTMVIGVMGCSGATRGTIGARFGRDPEGRLVVRDVPEGLGAAKAGLEPGDRILLIEGQDVRELSAERLHAVLSGEKGSVIRLTVERGQEVLRVTVARTAIPPKVLAR